MPDTHGHVRDYWMPVGSCLVGELRPFVVARGRAGLCAHLCSRLPSGLLVFTFQVFYIRSLPVPVSTTLPLCPPSSPSPSSSRFSPRSRRCLLSNGTSLEDCISRRMHEYLLPCDSNATSLCPSSAPCCSECPCHLPSRFSAFNPAGYSGEFGFCGTGDVRAYISTQNVASISKTDIRRSSAWEGATRSRPTP